MCSDFCKIVGMSGPAIPNEDLIVSKQTPAMSSVHVASFLDSSACQTIKQFMWIHKQHLRRNKTDINTLSIAEFCLEKWSWILLNWCIIDITKVRLASKCNRTIKTKHLSLKAMACTDIIYKNLNSNFIGHSVRIQPVGFCRYIWMLLLVQLLHVEMSAGTGMTNWTIQDRICLRDEIF